MGPPADLNPRIVEALYAEALTLADEVRTTFDPARRPPLPGPEDAARIALSCEALRATTRVMHSLSWLLNHRAYLKGEVSQFQLRRYGKLAASAPADPARLALLSGPVRELIGATERFHARLARLDAKWRAPAAPAMPALARLRERLGQVSPRG